MVTSKDSKPALLTYTFSGLKNESGSGSSHFLEQDDASSRDKANTSRIFTSGFIHTKSFFDDWPDAAKSFAGGRITPCCLSSGIFICMLFGFICFCLMVYASS